MLRHWMRHPHRRHAILGDLYGAYESFRNSERNVNGHRKRQVERDNNGDHFSEPSAHIYQ
jgi:hypothetical protein